MNKYITSHMCNVYIIDDIYSHINDAGSCGKSNISIIGGSAEKIENKFRQRIQAKERFDVV